MHKDIASLLSCTVYEPTVCCCGVPNGGVEPLRYVFIGRVIDFELHVLELLRVRIALTMGKYCGNDLPATRMCVMLYGLRTSPHVVLQRIPP